MSPSWRERLLIELAPQRVAFARLGRGFGAAVKARHVEPCAEAGGAAEWRAAAAALAAGLAALGARGAAATVIVSNACTRYQVVPWREGLSGAERGMMVRRGFERVFGAAVGAWEFRTSEAGYGLPALACAVDRALLAAIAEAVAASGARLASVQPRLMWACNGRRRELAGPASCLAVLEPGHACLAVAVDGHWQAVRGAAVSGTDPRHALVELIERELCLAALDPAEVPVYVHAPDFPGVRLASDRLPRAIVLDTAAAGVPARSGLAALAERR